MKAGIHLDENTQYAGFWRRVAAAVIDTLILLPLVGIILYLLYGRAYFDLPLESSASMTGAELRGQLFNNLILVVFTVFFWVKFLGTPGKLLLDCRIVHADTGQPLTVGRALLRYLGYYVSILPFLLGFFWIGWDKRKQGFHDKIAKTVVVIHDASAASLEELQAEFDKDTS